MEPQRDGAQAQAGPRKDLKALGAGRAERSRFAGLSSEAEQLLLPVREPLAKRAGSAPSPSSCLVFGCFRGLLFWQRHGRHTRGWVGEEWSPQETCALCTPV